MTNEHEHDTTGSGPGSAGDNGLGAQIELLGRDLRSLERMSAQMRELASGLEGSGARAEELLSLASSRSAIVRRVTVTGSKIEAMGGAEDARLAPIRRTLQAVLRDDKGHLDAIERAKSRLESEIAGMSRSSKAVRAYGSRGSGGARFQDREA